MRTFLALIAVVFTFPFAAAAQDCSTRDCLNNLRTNPASVRNRISDLAVKKRLQSRISRARVPAVRPVARRDAALATDLRVISRNGKLLKEGELLKDMRRLAADKEFTGVIGSVESNGVTLQLEKRNVLTDKGVQKLMLSKMGEDYVYDGDIVVPGSAVLMGEFLAENPPSGVAFAAGHAGGFGDGPLWDDGILPFEVSVDFCCLTALTQAIAAYETATPFRFVPRDGHATYIRFENSEPLLSSRTQLGKQPGANVVKIQGFLGFFGAPLSNAALSQTIQHEIGHELGLIHEHLRSDRDTFIARNPSCTTAGVFGFLRAAWIDLTQVAFADAAAELLTEYDFDSMMHYAFLVDSDGDGFGDCSSWVRVQTCPDGDPTDPACDGSFASAGLTALDVEGLLALYSALPIASNFGTDDEVRTFTGDNIRHRGRRIDPCLHGTQLFENGCIGNSATRVADEFCKTFGYSEGFNIETEPMLGQHSGFHRLNGWINVLGADAISSVSCRNVTINEQNILAGTVTETIFLEPDIRFDNLPIDRCMHGTTGITGDRCSNGNQGRIADAFCASQGHTDASAFETDFFGGFNFAGFFPSSGNFAHAGPGLDRFTEITCRD